MGATLNVQMAKIPVSDITKAVPFYRDVLGLSEDFVMAEYGWAQFSAGNLPVALYVPGMGGGTSAAGSVDCLHFATNDENAIRSRISDAGLNPDAHLHSGDDGSSYFELKDPDGNTFKIMLTKAG